MAGEAGVGGRDAGIWKSTPPPGPLPAAGVGGEPGRSGSAVLRLASARGSQQARRSGWVWGRRAAEGQLEERVCPPGGRGGAVEGVHPGRGGGCEPEYPCSL